MKHAPMLAMVAMLLSPAVSRAQAQCPWINPATIAGSNRASISVEVQKPGRGGTCSFAYHQGTVLYRVRITVLDNASHSMSLSSYRAQCATKEISLTGIGNDAVICRIKPRFPYAEQVIGRVRDRQFVVFVSSTSRPETRMIADTIRNTATRIAEQIAGNLY